MGNGTFLRAADVDEFISPSREFHTSLNADGYLAQVNHWTSIIFWAAAVIILGIMCSASTPRNRPGGGSGATVTLGDGHVL
jgi:hypothetical protein